MCVKLSLGDLNPGLFPPHPTSTYTCEVTIVPRVSIYSVPAIISWMKIDDVANGQNKKLVSIDVVVIFFFCFGYLPC